MGTLKGDVAGRFWAKVDIRSDDACWMWKGAEGRNRYGQFVIHHTYERGRELEQAHRVVMLLCGVDIRGKHIHHLCHEKLCVNPSHLKVMEPEDHVAEHKIWGKDEVLDAISRWARLYGDAPRASDWNVTMAKRNGWWDRVHKYEQGNWPGTSVVQRVFGSWSAALVASGFESPNSGRWARGPLARSVSSSER